MLHLEYLDHMLEKRGGFAVTSVRIFPERLVLKSPILSKVFGKFLVISTQISLSDTVHNREIWGICKDM